MTLVKCFVRFWCLQQTVISNCYSYGLRIIILSQSFVSNMSVFLRFHHWEYYYCPDFAKHEDEFAKAAKALPTKTFIDNVVTEADNLEEALELQHQLIQV